MTFLRPVLYLLPSISLQLIQDKSSLSCFLYFALAFIGLVVGSLTTIFICLINLMSAVPIHFWVFVSFLLIILYILRYLYSNKPEVIFKWFKFFLILHFCILVIILLCNSSDLALRLYPLDNVFINLFNERLVSCFYYYTVLASLSLYIYTIILYSVKLKDSCSSSYNYYLERMYVLYLTYKERIYRGLIFNLILILVMYIMFKFALLCFICFVFGVKPGIYIIFFLNISFIHTLAFFYNKVYMLREEKTIITALFSIFITWIMAISIFELNMYLFGGCFIIYLWYNYFDDKLICNQTNILSFNNYAQKAEYISNMENLSDLDKSNLLMDEIVNVQNEINNNTRNVQFNSNIELPHVELPSERTEFDSWFSGLKSYTDQLFSSLGETAMQNNRLFSHYFPNSLGIDGLIFEPRYVDIHRIHALSVLHTSSDICKVKYQWSLKAYDILHDPRRYPTYPSDGSKCVKFRDLERIDLEQYMFIKNIVQRLGDANFNSKIEVDVTSVHNVLEALHEHMHTLEQMAYKMDRLFTKSYQKMHELRGATDNLYLPLISKNVSDGHLPLFKSKGIVLPFPIVFYGDRS